MARKKKPTEAERIEANVLRKVASALRGTRNEGGPARRRLRQRQDGDDVPLAFDAVRAANELEAHAKKLDGDPQAGIDICPVARCESWVQGVDSKECFEGDGYYCNRGHYLRVAVDGSNARLVWDGKKRHRGLT